MIHKQHNKRRAFNQEDQRTMRERKEAQLAAREFKRLDRAHTREQLARGRRNRRITLAVVTVGVVLMLLYTMRADQVALVNGWIH